MFKELILQNLDKYLLVLLGYQNNGYFCSFNGSISKFRTQINTKLSLIIQKINSLICHVIRLT